MHKFSFISVVSAARTSLFAVLLFIFPNVDVNLPTILTQQTTSQTSQQFEAQAILDQGVQAFKNGQYEEAARTSYARNSWIHGS